MISKQKSGGYYYYKTEREKNYEHTVLDVQRYANEIQIPYRYIQYDSWWYHQAPFRQGVTEWTSKTNVFPHGLGYMFNKTGWTVIAHNRWWSPKTNYAKQNGGTYDFHLEYDTNLALPLEERFWTDLMIESKKWGLRVYEQDWLNKQFDEMHFTTRNVGVARKWLLQMGRGANKAGINIQYCMSPSRAALQSVEIPIVSQVNFKFKF